MNRLLVYLAMLVPLLIKLLLFGAATHFVGIAIVKNYNKNNKDNIKIPETVNKLFFKIGFASGFVLIVFIMILGLIFNMDTLSNNNILYKIKY